MADVWRLPALDGGAGAVREARIWATGFAAVFAAHILLALVLTRGDDVAAGGEPVQVPSFDVEMRWVEAIGESGDAAQSLTARSEPDELSPVADAAVPETVDAPQAVESTAEPLEALPPKPLDPVAATQAAEPLAAPEGTATVAPPPAPQMAEAEPIRSPSPQTLDPIAPEAAPAVAADAVEAEAAEAIEAAPMPRPRPATAARDVAEAEAQARRQRAERRERQRQQAEAQTRRERASAPRSDGENLPPQEARGGAAGGARPQETGSGGTSAATYNYLVYRHLQRYKRFPGGARRGGTVVIAFTLDAAGSASRIRISRSSGNPALDEATIAMVSRANPFPGIPAELRRSSMTFTVPVSFTPR